MSRVSSSIAVAWRRRARGSSDGHALPFSPGSVWPLTPTSGSISLRKEASEEDALGPRRRKGVAADHDGARTLHDQVVAPRFAARSARVDDAPADAERRVDGARGVEPREDSDVLGAGVHRRAEDDDLSVGLDRDALGAAAPVAAGIE